MVQIMQLLITCANILDSPVTFPSSPALISLISQTFSYLVDEWVYRRVNVCDYLCLACSVRCILIAQYFLTVHPLWVYCTFINYFKRKTI
jgi:hypothetical protein